MCNSAVIVLLSVLACTYAAILHVNQVEDEHNSTDKSAEKLVVKLADRLQDFLYKSLDKLVDDLFDRVTASTLCATRLDKTTLGKLGQHVVPPQRMLLPWTPTATSLGTAQPVTLVNFELQLGAQAIPIQHPPRIHCCRSIRQAGPMVSLRKSLDEKECMPDTNPHDKEKRMQFEACTLRFEDWDHHMHVRVALNTLQTFGSAIGYERFVEGVKRYNQAAIDDGHRIQKYAYHTTITRFWFEAIRDRAQKDDSVDTLLKRHPELGSFALSFKYYDRESLFTDKYANDWYPPPTRRELRQHHAKSNKDKSRQAVRRR